MKASIPQSSSPRNAGRQGPVRVLWLIKGLGPGGAEQLLVNHAGVRDRVNFTYEAAYLVPVKRHHVETLEGLDVPVTLLDGDRELDPRWMLRLRRLIKAHRIEVVHTHSPYVAAMARLVVRTLPSSRRPGLVYTEHNRWPRHSRATRWANMITYPLDDIQIAVSEDVKTTIPRFLRWPVEVIEHGVNIDRVRAFAADRGAVRNELDIGDDDVVIGIVANFRAEKAYDVFLDAAAFALHSHETSYDGGAGAESNVDSDTDATARSDAGPRGRLRFVSVGQGPLEAMMRARTRDEGLDDDVILLGYRADATRVMTAFDIFTLSSRHEGLPVALMDALVLGLPIVATRVGGIPEVITDGREGHLVGSGDSEALARAWLDLAGDPARRRRIGHAAATRGNDFDINQSVARLERLYRAAVRKPPV